MLNGEFPKNVLVIGWVWPEPKASAAGDHMLSILQLLKAQGCHITFASPAQKTDLSAPLESIGVHCQAIEVNNTSFDEFLQKLNPYLVVFDRYMMEEQFGWRVEKVCPDAIRVLDTEDLHSLREYRQQQAKVGSNNDNTASSENVQLHSDKGIREVASIYRCDLSLIISKAEFELLQNTYQLPQSILHHLPFCLPEAHKSQVTSQETPGFERRKDFITIGNFRHPPNWDSVLWLKKLWPEIRRQLPGVNLHIYGAYLPKKASELHNQKQGFLVHGWVDDAYEVMQQARVCLSPLRFGAGLKGKLLLAMSAGTPSVTTSVGAESMTDDQWPGLLAESDSEIVQSAVELYINKSAWQSRHELSLRIAQERYGSDQWGQSLVDAIAQISADVDRHRSGNFVGQILRHQHHRATQFMSQWIEAKNKLSELQDE